MLEKILEEIIEQLKAEGCIIDDDAGNRAEEIIRKHMNAGWIPMEDEKKPEEYETVLCVTDKNYQFVAVYNQEYGFRTGDIYVEGGLVAWQPSPGPYKKE